MRTLTRSFIASPLRSTPISTRPRSSRIAALPSLRQRHFASSMAAPEGASTPDITPESLSQTLKEKLEATHTTIDDISGGCGQAFNATIVSPQFTKKNTLARHRLVNSALKQEIALIHAWSPKCFSPEEWEERKKNTTEA